MNKKANRFLYPVLAICLAGLSMALIFSRGDIFEIFAILAAVSVVPSFFYILIAFLSMFFIKNDLLAILTSLSLAYFCAYTIFRIMHWPGSLIFFLLGAVLALTAVVAAVSNKSSGENEKPS